MEANELRIGNYVMASYGDDNFKVEKVTAVLNYGINQYYDGAEFMLDYIKPIPLTEELLVKMGGMTTNDSTWLDFIISSHTPFVSYNHADKCFYFHTAALEDKFSFKVLYLHQLQNLYFALTGEELVIK